MPVPLTDSDLEDIKTGLAALQDVDEQLTKAELAGIDVAKQRVHADTAKKRLQGIKDAYFPGQ